MEKLIITAAVTGSLPTKRKTPHVPITPAEIVEAGVRCEAAGEEEHEDVADQAGDDHGQGLRPDVG